MFLHRSRYHLVLNILVLLLLLNSQYHSIFFQVAELQRLRREEARRTAEIEEALASVLREDSCVEGREQALRTQLENIRQQHADRLVLSLLDINECLGALNIFTRM